jgi:hypothetical protein
MANVSVDFAILEEKHPSYRSIRSLVSGIPSYVNETCCVQISYAFNRAGAVIENYAYTNPLYQRKVRAFRGGDGMAYIFEVSDMRYYLDNRYGPAENFGGSKQQIIDNIGGRHGIFAFGYRHIDLWLGDDIHRPYDYRMDYLWTNDSIKQRGAFFWEVTSQWGF